MNKKKIIKNLLKETIIIFGFIFIINFNLKAQTYFTSEAVGTTSGNFLNFNISPRASGMGGVQTAIAEDVSAIYSNPAGLIQISKLSAMFMRTQYVADINYQFAAYAHRLTYNSVVAGSILITDMGTINYTDDSNNQSGTFAPKDQVITLSYSKGIIEFSDKETDVSMGIAYKYINSKIFHSAKATAFDLGIMTYNFTYIPYRLAVVMQNLGSGLRYDEESNSLPLTFKIGASINPFKNLMFATDFVIPKSNKSYFIIGGEITTQTSLYNKLSIRGGVNLQKTRDKIGSFNFGLGMMLHFFSIDYSFEPMGDLGSTHKLSLTFDFPVRSQVFQRKDKSIYSKITDISLK